MAYQHSEKLAKVQELLARTIDGVSSSPERWSEFLSTAGAKFYKYNFADQALIFAQRPDAAACASFSLWNRLERYVKRGSTGIALLEENGETQKLRYVFDVSDTGGRSSFPRLWSCGEEFRETAAKAISEAYGSDAEDIGRLVGTATLSLAYDYLNDAGVDSNELLSLAAHSASIAVLSRMGLTEEALPNVRAIETIEYDDIILLGNASNYAAGEILRTVERAILNEHRERRKLNAARNEDRKRDNLRETGRLLDTGAGNAGTEGSGTLRENEAEVHTREQESPLRRPDMPLRAELVSEPDRRGGGRDGEPSGERASGKEPSAGQGEGSDGLDGAHEHDTGTGDGADYSGADLQLEDEQELELSPEPVPAKAKTRGESAGQLSLFPTEEEQIEEIESRQTDISRAKTYGGRKLTPNEILDVRHILLADETLLSQKYLVYKNLTRDPNAAVVSNWLRDIHKTALPSWITLPDGDGRKKAFTTYDAKGIRIAIQDAASQSGEIRISWTQARAVLLDLIRERKFISEEELSARAGQTVSALPQIPQADIDRIIMPPPESEYSKNVVYKIVSENKGGDLTYDSIFVKNSYTPHAATQYHFRDGTIGRVEAGDDGVYIEKPGHAPSFVSMRQAYDRIAEFVADGTYYEKYYEDNRLLTHKAVEAILCMGPSTAWGKEEIFDTLSSTWDDETKLLTVQGCYPIGESDTLLSPDNANEAARIYYDEDGMRIHVYDIETIGEHGARNVEYAFLTWEEVKERIEQLIAEGRYQYETGPDFINDDGALAVDEKEIREFLRGDIGFLGAKNRIAEAYASGGREAMEGALFAEYDGARYGFNTRDSSGARIYNAVRVDPSVGMRYEKTRNGAWNAPSAQRTAIIDGGRISDILEDLIQRGTYLDEKDRSLAEDVVAGVRKITEADVAEICRADHISTREKIFNAFQKTPTSSERQKALKAIYGQSGHTFVYPSGLCGFVSYDGRNVSVEKADVKASFSYAEVAKVIAGEIEKGTYITREEREAVQERYVESEEPDVPARNENNPETPHIPLDYRITDENIGVGTPKERYANNIAAIKLLKGLEASGRAASAEEQETLAKYVGWGGLSGVFDDRDSGWDTEYHELLGLLSEDEYRSARASTLTSYYTPPVVTKALYSTLERMGFTGGNVLEPAMGIGHFFGTMPDSMRKNSRLYGVELDSLTGRIAKQLYQSAAVSLCGYEDTDYPDNFFDAAIGNVPFGQYKVADKRYAKLNYSIHDYFFAKTLDKVRPGGVVAFITSRYTMDKENPSVRRYIAQRAELLGAVRLPDTVFKRAAGTDAVSDVLILQKRERLMDVEPEWIFTGKTDDGIPINEYYLKHPEMVCGKIELTSSAYGPTPTCSARDDAPLSELLNSALSRIEGRVTESAVVLDEDEERALETIPADPNVRNFSYTIVCGEVYYRENAVMYKPEKAVGTRAERIKGLVALRDCTRELIDYQLYGYSDEDIEAKQRELRQM